MADKISHRGCMLASSNGAVCVSSWGAGAGDITGETSTAVVSTTCNGPHCFSSLQVSDTVVCVLSAVAETVQGCAVPPEAKGC